MSLHKKLMTIFVLSITLTFIPLLLLIQFYVRPLNTRQVESDTVQLMTSKANEVGSWLNQRVSELRVIHQFPACRTMDFEQIKPYLTQLNQIVQDQYGNPEETFAIGGRDGRGWINDNLTIDVSARPYFNEAMSTEEEYVISEPVISKSDSNQIFLICYPIRDNFGETIGFINGSVNLKHFSQITDSIDIYDGLVWLMSREGNIYTVTEEEHLRAELSAEDLNRLSGESLIRSAGSLYLTNQTGKNVTLFYSSVPYADDWVLCAMVDNAKIHATTTQISRILVAACAVLLAAAILSTSLLSASILKPIRHLKENMQQVAQGNLDAYYTGQGNDEISVLGRSFNQMLTRLKESIRQSMKEQQQKRQAELRALQSQINPHFLYNTLDTIQWKALEYHAMDIAEMIQMLSQLFRISLNNGKEMISVSEELTHVRSYLAIQKIRYGETIDYTIESCKEASSVTIPKLIIQPLVENSIYHGIKPKGSPGRIAIRLWCRNKSLYIQVEDDGVGIPPDRLKAIRSDLNLSLESDHYGLYNVNERLRLRYGSGYQLLLESTAGTKTLVCLVLPITDIKPEDNPGI